MHIKQFFILLFLGLVISGCGNDDTIGTEISESSNVEGNGDSSSNDQELSSEDLMSSEERSSGAGVGLEPESSNDVVSSEAQDTLTRSSSENVLSSVEQVSSSSENVEISSSEEILSSSEAVVSNPDNTAMSDEAFTLVAIPDTQYMLIGFRHTRDHFKQQMAWIVSQKDALNIKFVTHLGDIVENGAYDEEWAFASTEMKVFEDADMPYGLAPGNHDTDDWAGAWAENMDYGSLDQMHNYFTLDRYSIYPWWGGSYPDETIKNSYQFFTGAGMNFIIIHLRHGYGDDVQQWAKSILDTHADKRAIIINHDPYYDKANQLAKEHANVFMLLGGHHCSR
ncbi:MAG: metallophosphoesterase, partial [Fibrobacterales bacterium]